MGQNGQFAEVTIERSANMTEAQINKILECKAKGLGYKKTAKEVGVHYTTIQKFLKKYGGGDVLIHSHCLECGKPIVYSRNHRPRKFCCQDCRNAYWNREHGMNTTKASKPFVCERCGKTFLSFRKHPHFCSRECYLASATKKR